jgi:hypothetical protein
MRVRASDGINTLTCMGTRTVPPSPELQAAQ